MSAIELLKQQSQNSSILQEIERAAGKSNTQSYVDSRKWKLTRDASNNGSAVIRFLPAPKGESSPFVKMNKYNFQYPEKTGKWYIENSLYNPGAGNQKDPCYIAWQNLKNSPDPEDQLRAKAIARVVVYTSNILVINDPAHPENNGKVFLFDYGPQIFEMIQKKVAPEFDDETPLNIFDAFNGANFKLRANIGKTKRLTYERSEFDSPSRLAPIDDEIVAIWEKCYPLQPEVAADKFKSFETLEKRLNEVLYPGASKPVQAPSAPAPAHTTSARLYDDNDDVPSFPSTPAPSIQIDDDDDEMSYFASLANDD